MRDLRRALDLVRQWNDDSAFLSLADLGSLVGSDAAAVIGSDHVARRLTTVNTTRPERNLLTHPGFEAAVAHHPGFAAHRSGRLALGTSAALTELASLTALRRLPLYVDFYRPAGTVDQLLCVVKLNGRQGSVLTFNRSRPGFSRRDRELVELLAPHLTQAMARREQLAALTSYSRLPELTAREQQVAVHVADGATDREIARNLGISPRTVHKHLEQIYRKLDLTNRAGLSALIHRAQREPGGACSPAQNQR